MSEQQTTVQDDTGLMIDLDGVLYQADAAIDGAVEALDWIRSQAITHCFVTNTTSRSRAALVEKFERFGFAAEADEIVTPIVAATRYLAERGWRRAALFVPDEARPDFGSIEAVPEDSDADVDAVIIGDLGHNWSFERLNRAFRLLMREPRPQLIALGMTRYWRGPQGLQLDVAPFVRALEHAADTEAAVVGKPAAEFFQAALSKLGCQPDSALMIGDDIRGDVDAAQRCGIRGILVRTGKFRPADLEGEIEPFAVLESFAELPAWWQAGG